MQRLAVSRVWACEGYVYVCVRGCRFLQRCRVSSSSVCKRKYRRCCWPRLSSLLQAGHAHRLRHVSSRQLLSCWARGCAAPALRLRHSSAWSPRSRRKNLSTCVFRTEVRDNCRTGEREEWKGEAFSALFVPSRRIRRRLVMQRRSDHVMCVPRRDSARDVVAWTRAGARRRRRVCGAPGARSSHVRSLAALQRDVSRQLGWSVTASNGSPRAAASLPSPPCTCLSERGWRCHGECVGSRAIELTQFDRRCVTCESRL